MSLDRRFVLLGASALGLAAASGARATTADRELETIIAEIMRSPNRPRSSRVAMAPLSGVLPDLSPAGSERGASETQGWAARLTRLRDAPLTGESRDTLEAALWDLDAGEEWRRDYWFQSPLSADDSALSSVVERLSTAPLDTAPARDVYLATLEALPPYIDQIGDKVRGQRARKITQHRETVAAAARQTEAMLAAPDKNFVPAAERLKGVPPADAARFQARANAIVTEKVVPGLKRLATYLRDDYLPQADDAVGLWRFPGGEQHYRFLMRVNVTRELDPKEAHLGALAAVAAADADLADLRRKMGVTDSAEAFHAGLLTDPRWKSATPQEVSARFQRPLDRMKPHLSRFFEAPPSTPYGAEPQAPEYNDVLVNGRYQWPTVTDPRGAYLFNGGDLQNTSWFWATPLSYHELVPGHHLQLDRIYASTTLSPYRKSLALSGGVEGWAEYARHLVIEAGVYDDDPMGRYADRLMDRRMAMMAVADTGMHVHGWSLDKAVEYFSTNAITKPAQQRRAMLGIATEYPAFLLSYWAGGEEYARLKRVCRNLAGPGFDVRQFHETILSGGVLPFPVIEARLRRRFDPKAAVKA